MESVCSVRKKIAIIGAGCSGLAAIKSCLDEGLEPVCLEKSGVIGGLWNYSDKENTGGASIYESLVINTSKEMMMFSDFPPPEHFPPFLSHSKVLEYFHMYAKNFNLVRHILFNTNVRHVTKADDYEITGRWRVTYSVAKQHSKPNCCDREDFIDDVFDGVMICSGHHSVPYIPQITGMENFEGRVLHSHSYKNSTPFDGKRVVILGMGNSATDIACDLAKSADQVFLSSRRGAWIVPRTAFWGLPADMLANSRIAFTLPLKVLDWCVQLQANFRLDHEGYGLKPQHGVLNSHPTINDELVIHIVAGRVQAAPQISLVDEKGVWFGPENFCPCDVIILATGYDYKLDFVDEDVLKIDNNQATLYKFMFPPHLPHPTLAVIGLIQAIGAVMPISEIQARWFGRLQTGTVRLPSRQAMEDNIEKKRESMAKLYVESRRHTMQTFWIDYMDQIASQIGARPNLWKMLFSDPELAVKCYLGPCLPSQYRLVGPHTWPQARTFIVGALTRATRSRSFQNVSRLEEESKSRELRNVMTDKEKNTPDQPLPTACGDNVSAAAGSHRDLRNRRTDNSNCPASLDKGREVSSELPETNQAENGGHRRLGGLSPEWITLAFYVVLILVCYLIWLLCQAFDQAESLLNAVDGVVETGLPFSD